MIGVLMISPSASIQLLPEPPGVLGDLARRGGLGRSEVVEPDQLDLGARGLCGASAPP